jgi:hypothetical protein
MRDAIVVLALTALTGCAPPMGQVLLITDYEYSLDGKSVAKLEQLNDTLRVDAPIVIEACSCADTRLVIAATEWLQSRGVKRVSMSTIPGTEAKCGVCK